MKAQSIKGRPSSNKSYVIWSFLVGVFTGLNLSGLFIDTSSSVQVNLECQNAIEQRDRWVEESNKLEDSSSNVRLKELEHPLGQIINSNSNKTEENPNLHSICQKLSYPTPSALALWKQHIPQILKSSQLLPNDGNFQFHDFTAQLLQIITPRLPRSVKTISQESKSIEKAMTVAWERFQYMKLLSNEEKAKIKNPPRPLKILVMGGSLLVGTNCRRIVKEVNFQGLMPNRGCTWANRLDRFLNQFFDTEIVQVTKVAMGGTNTATGSVIFQYDLVPEHARDPDIVINAYSTNDMHILTILEAQSSNMTLRDKTFEMIQDFARQVLRSCDPKVPPPLLLHIDDYLGNEQRNIWETTELSQGVHVLANYYGFASASFADLVRSIVYGDTKEKWFSSDWWETGKFERQIHPYMGAHITSTWVVAYNLLNMVTTYCSLPSEAYNLDVEEYTAGVMGFPPLRHDLKEVSGKPHAPPLVLPPLLTKDLLIEDVSTLWKQASEDTSSCNSFQGTRSEARCPFSWISGLSLQQNNKTWIEESFRQKASEWNGWKLSDDGGKLGFVPTLNDKSEMMLEFVYPRQTIRTVTVFFMKSYGEKWENSQLKLTVNASQSLHEMDLSGVHAKQTSEVYHEEIQLKSPLTDGGKLQVRAKLEKGSTFKLMGLAVCS